MFIVYIIYWLKYTTRDTYQFFSEYIGVLTLFILNIQTCFVVLIIYYVVIVKRNYPTCYYNRKDRMPN